jgi:hypothetical protein
MRFCPEKRDRSVAHILGFLARARRGRINVRLMED